MSEPVSIHTQAQKAARLLEAFHSEEWPDDVSAGDVEAIVRTLRMIAAHERHVRAALRAALLEVEEMRQRHAYETVVQHPAVSQVLEAFPGATLSVRDGA